MTVDLWYRKFCAKYQKLLRKIFKHKWQTGQFWGIDCECKRCNELSMYYEEVYRLRKIKMWQKTFEILEDAMMHFDSFSDENSIVWCPSWWDIQKAIYDYDGFILTRSERMASTLPEALLAFLKYMTLFEWDEETQKELGEAVEKLRKYVKEGDKNVRTSKSADE